MNHQQRCGVATDAPIARGMGRRQLHGPQPQQIQKEQKRSFGKRRRSWQGAIGRLRCRTRFRLSIGPRCRTDAPKITQPGAYTENTQPRCAAQGTLGPMRAAPPNDAACHVLGLANHNGTRVAGMSWSALTDAAVRMDRQLAMQPRAGAMVVLALGESNRWRLRAIYTLAVPLAPWSPLHSLLSPSGPLFTNPKPSLTGAFYLYIPLLIGVFGGLPV